MPITVRRDPYASADCISVPSRAKPGQAWAGWLGRGSVREQAPCRGRLLSDAQALSAPLAIVLLLVGSQAAALGLGELRVRSALHQPFQGEIELFEVERSDLDRIAARLANPAAFEQAGLERPAFLTEMRFTPMIGPDGGAMLEVISREPIREPYLALLLELRWPDGRLVKEYAVLLDPPAVGGEREQGQGQGQAEAPSRLRARPARSPLAAVADRFPLRYGPVPAGVGLTEVGRRLAMPGVTLEQIALAFYRNSPDAFVDGNINRLRQGVELIIPSRAELLALTADAAREQYWAAVTGARIAQVPLTDVDAPLTSASQE
ncbi:MAG: FimV family protein, partial [Halochromatium sp.]